jgi:hypothetical protein
MNTRTEIALLATSMVIVGASVLKAEEPVTPASLQPCPYSAEEIQSALGVTVERGEAADMTFPGGRDVGCIYPVKNSQTVLSVRQTWDPSGSSGGDSAAKHEEGGLQPIAGDSDGASWRVKRNEHSVELVYTRAEVRTRVLVHGGTFDDDDMQPRLLTLRRVP